MSESVPEITRGAIRAAARRITGHVRETPVLVLPDTAEALPNGLALKLDFLQPTGSFKVRGAFNLLLDTGLPDAGVVAASGGNFGLAVAYVARSLQAPAHIFVPNSSPQAKLKRLNDYGAVVHMVPGYYPEALVASRQHVEDHGGLFAHAYDQARVVAGQGTIGPEIADQLPEIDTVIVAVGGGGLIGGIASWFRNDVRVVAVETEGTPTLARARVAGQPVDVDVGGIAASSLGAGRLGDIAWFAASRWVDDAVLVPDAAAQDAQRALWEQVRLLVEPAAAITLAALATGRYRPSRGERICLVLSGANVDPRSTTDP